METGGTETPFTSASYHTQIHSMMCCMLANIFSLPVAQHDIAHYLHTEEPRQWHSRKSKITSGALAYSSISRSNRGSARQSALRSARRSIGASGSCRTFCRPDGGAGAIGRP